MLKWFLKRINNKKGFTLVELVVVIAILGTLSAIAIPKFSSTTGNANRTAVEANLRVIESAATLYEAENGVAPESISKLVEEGFLQSAPEGPDKVTYNWNKDAKKAEASKNSSGSWWTDDDTISLPVDWKKNTPES